MGPGFESLKVHQQAEPAPQYRVKYGVIRMNVPRRWKPQKANTTRSVSVFTAEGPPVPIPNTEVKLCWGENTCLETSREDSSMLTSFDRNLFLSLLNFKKQAFWNCRIFLAKNTHTFPKGKSVGDITAEGPPVPIPNTEVKLCWAEDTCLETSRENRSLPTPKQLSHMI